MSEEPSFEQLSISSNDSWALLDTVDAEDVAADVVDLTSFNQPGKTCFICNQPLSEIYYTNPSCPHCPICTLCHETHDPQSIPACYHKYQDATVSVFVFDDSAEGNVLVTNCKECCLGDVQTKPGGSTASPMEPHSCRVQPDTDKVDAASPDDSEYSVGYADSDYKSLADHVREALQLHTGDEESSDISSSNENQAEVKDKSKPLPQTHSVDPEQIKRILSPKMWSQSETISTNMSSVANSSCFQPSKLPSIPALRPSVQLVQSPCSVSECQTSSSSSSSRSPPSLSSSPLCAASKAFKSAALHSANAMNHFDCMPMDAFDPVSIISDSSASCVAAFRDSKDYVKRCIWDKEKMNAMLKPKPVPPSVLEQSAYNLR